MTPRERFLRTIRGEPADRVPLNLLRMSCASRRELDAMTDPGRREIAERVFDETAAGVHFGIPANRYFVTPKHCIRQVSEEPRDGYVRTTTEVDTPKGILTAITERDPAVQTSWTLKFPCNSREDIEAIRSIPWEVPDDLGPPDLSKLPPEFDRKGYVRTGVSSPFVCVAGMMPREMFLEMCLTDLPLIEELTNECLRRALDLLDRILADGTVEYVWIGGCEWLTPPMASPELYERLVQPQERAIITKAHEAGALAHVHCHGNVGESLERVIDRGADFFEPVEPPPDGNITFADAKRVAAGRITLGGNIEARIIEHGSQEEVERATREAFEGGKERMVLQTSAGPISEMSPRTVANYHRLIDLWEECSEL